MLLEFVDLKRDDYPIRIFQSVEDEGYIADIPDLHYCSAFGDTLERALAELMIAKATWAGSRLLTGTSSRWPKPA